MAGESEPAVAVTVANAEAQTAAAAAEAAQVAATQAVATATALSAEHASAAARAVEEIHTDTVEAIEEQEDEIAWLRQQAESYAAQNAELRDRVNSLQAAMESGALKTAEALESLRTMLAPLIPPQVETPASETMPPETPPASADAPPAAPAKVRKRRLI